MTSSWGHESAYDTHLSVVINLAKFDVCTSISFGGVNPLMSAVYSHLRFYINLAYTVLKAKTSKFEKEKCIFIRNTNVSICPQKRTVEHLGDVNIVTIFGSI